MNIKIAFPELVKLIAESTGTTQRMSELFLKELFATVSEALIAGQNVAIKNLGNFETVVDAMGRPRLSFTPDKALAAAVNQPFAAFESIVLSDDLTDDMLRRIDEDENADIAPAEPFTPPEPDEPAVAHEPTEPHEPVVAHETPPRFKPKPAEEEPQGLATSDEPSTSAPISEPTEISEPCDNSEPCESQDTESFTEHTVQHFIKLEFEEEKREVAHKSFIKGMFTGIFATLTLGAIIWGAWNGGRNSALKSVEQADTLTEAGTYEEESIKVPEQPIQSQRTPATQAAVVTDTCTATMYLSRMSIKHYGKPDFWIYIYEENRDKISDPNNVPPGMVLIIPPAEKYGIDAHDKFSIDRARWRTYELMAK